MNCLIHWVLYWFGTQIPPPMLLGWLVGSTCFFLVRQHGLSRLAVVGQMDATNSKLQALWAKFWQHVCLYLQICVYIFICFNVYVNYTWLQFYAHIHNYSFLRTMRITYSFNCNVFKYVDIYMPMRSHKRTDRYWRDYIHMYSLI